MSDVPEMVERVARAMYDSMRGIAHNGSDPWDTRIHETQATYRGLARAAIAAMHEPTDAMIEAGWSEPVAVNDDGTQGTPTPDAAWRAMIEAALGKQVWG